MNLDYNKKMCNNNNNNNSFFLKKNLGSWLMIQMSLIISINLIK